MSKFQLNVYYDEIAVFQSPVLDYSDVIDKLNDLIDFVYDFSYMFGDHVIRTKSFNYVIEEVE